MILKLIRQIELLLFHRLNNIAGRYNCHLTPYELKKCKNDTFLFDGGDCTIKALDFLLKCGREERKVKSGIVEYNLQLPAHNGSGFDTWIISKKLPCDKNFVDLIENGKGIISLRVFFGYIQNNKK